MGETLTTVLGRDDIGLRLEALIPVTDRPAPHDTSRMAPHCWAAPNGFRRLLDLVLVAAFLKRGLATIEDPAGMLPHAARL